MDKISGIFGQLFFGKEDVGWIKLDEETEYRKGNTYFCKNCNTPTAGEIKNDLGLVFTQRMTCKCKAERQEKERKERELQDKQRQIRKLIKSSLIAERYQNVTFENTKITDNQEFKIAFERCKKYCEISDEAIESGYGIYLFGDAGTGKTHLTACMNKVLTNKLHTTLFTNFFEISQNLKETFKGGSESSLLATISSVDFLFLDDLGTERVQKNGENMWLQEKIFEIINMRYNRKKSTIFSSNYSISELVSQRGIMPKTADRITEMSTVQLKITGTSFRGLKNTNINF